MKFDEHFIKERTVHLGKIYQIWNTIFPFFCNLNCKHRSRIYTRVYVLCWRSKLWEIV